MAIGELPAKPKTKRVRGRPRPEHVAALEGELLEVALREFLQHGYGGASMARIVKVAGVSKTTLYSRYASKDELFRAIIHRQIAQGAPSEILQSKSQPFDLEQGLKAYADHMIEIHLQGDLLGVNRLLYSESHRFPELGAAAAERTALGIKRIARFIQDCAVADGIPCKDSKSVAQVFILMLRGWYIDVLLTNREVSASMRAKWVNRAVHTLLSARSDW
jgi:AcrR family transcriptional regulator